MNVAWRNGLPVLVLAVALIGCGKSGPANKPAPPKVAPGTATSASAGASECVVGVEGMS
jgi:hypothetical protein